MRTSFHLGVACVAVALASACGADESNQDLQVLSAELQQGREEVARHLQTCLSAPALGDVVSESSWHQQQMGLMLAEWKGELTGMSYCRGQGMDRIQGMMRSMSGELNAHAGQLASATTLEDARARCVEHSELMSQMLDDAEDGIGQMGMSCPMMTMRM